MDTKAFAECMKRNMDKQGITTEDLSSMTDISVARLEECMSGEVTPKVKELKAIATALKVPLLVLKSGGGWVHFSELDEDGKKVCRWEEY